MSSEQLKHIQKIRGFQHQKFEFFKKKLIWHIKKQKIQCILCGSDDVKLNLSGKEKSKFFQWVIC